MTKNNMWALVGLVVVAVIVVFTLSGGPAQNPPTGDEASGAPSGESKDGTSAIPSPQSGAPTTQKPASSNVIISPKSGEKMVIGQVYAISWSKKSLFKGFIYLANASTKEIVGWINSETKPGDTSYNWDVRDLFLSRYNPSKKPVGVGKYVIGVGFDSKETPSISNSFEIIYPSQVPVGNYEVIFKNYLASPSALTVKKGSQLVFTNQDSVAHKIVSGSINFLVEPQTSQTFDTNNLFPGKYDFYSQQYPAARVQITVQ